MIGEVVRQYKIIQKLGAGGMGTVYKARDTKLDRFVALKFLTTQLSQDDENKNRFIHEAKAASALDHPNICTIFEINETNDGQMFIAMAYYEGESLRERIKRGPMKLEDVCDVSSQIAAGLASAHARSIIHRDIKAGNIIITTEHTVKVLDFGLAKLAGQTKLTQTGVTLGTANYMAPEQARAEPVDHRCDIWSLGVAIYEMVTGQTPFQGHYPQAVMYSILNETPEPLTALRTGLPIDLEKIVNKCLSKSPGDRYQHISEIPVDLKAIAQGMPKARQAATPPPGLGEKPSHRLIPWSLALIIVVISIVFAIRGGGPGNQVPASVARFAITLPPGHRLTGTTAVAISPDGQRLAFSAAQSNDDSRLYLRKLSDFSAREIPGTKGGVSPFFSPDGRWLGFFAEKRLMKVAVTGGTPLMVCEVPTLSSAFQSASWGEDDSIVFPIGLAGGLARVEAAGGKPKMLKMPTAEKGELGYQRPRILPGGKALLFGLWTSKGSRLGVLSLATGERRFFHDGPGSSIVLFGGQYVATGHVIFVESGELRAIPFDLETLQATGSPIPLPEKISSDRMATAGSFAISENGTLAFVAQNPSQNRLVWVDRTGQSSPALTEPGLYENPRLSADGERVVVTSETRKGTLDLVVFSLERGELTRLTFKGTINNFSVWSQDGSQIVFNTTREHPGIYSKPADASGQAKMLLARSYPRLPGSLAHNSANLTFTELNPKTGKDIWTLNRTSSVASPLLTSPFDEHSPIFSPDDSWLIYVSDESGRDEIYGTSYPALNKKRTISIGGGTEPVLSHDGDELFYRNGNKMMSVTVQFAPGLLTGKPKVLFEGKWATTSIVNANYDLSPDDQRFLMVKEDESPTASELRVVINWFSELKNYISRLNK